MNPKPFNILVSNLDPTYSLGIYWVVLPVRDSEKDRLTKVLTRVGGGDSQYRMGTFSGHEFIVRSSDHRFRFAFGVEELEEDHPSKHSHSYRLKFLNLQDDQEDHAPIEVNSNGFNWIDPQKMHSFVTNAQDSFELRSGDKKAKVSLKILPAADDDKTDL
jgi:hypothetical protein